jgi:hypothetical protein
MLADVPVVETLNPEVVEYLEDIRQVHQREIQPIVRSDPVLYRQIDPENEKRLYQYVDKEQEKDVDDKFAVHGTKKRGLHGLLADHADSVCGNLAMN